MSEQRGDETPEEFRARMQSVGLIKGGRTRPLEKVITRPEAGDPASGENKLDAGKRAKVVINEDRDVILTTSDNRQDANVIGTAARAGGAGGRSELWPSRATSTPTSSASCSRRRRTRPASPPTPSPRGCARARL
jgi:hypothetical protein